MVKNNIAAMPMMATRTQRDFFVLAFIGEDLDRLYSECGFRQITDAMTRLGRLGRLGMLGRLEPSKLPRLSKPIV